MTPILPVRSRNCLRTALAAIRSLKGRTNLIVLASSVFFSGDKILIDEDQFRVLKKCHGKFDCLVYEILSIKELRPSVTLKVIPLVLNSLFTLQHILLPLFLNEVLFFHVFIEYSYCFFLLDNDVRERRNVVFLTVF